MCCFERLKNTLKDAALLTMTISLTVSARSPKCTPEGIQSAIAVGVKDLKVKLEDYPKTLRKKLEESASPSGSSGSKPPWPLPPYP